MGGTEGCWALNPLRGAHFSHNVGFFAQYTIVGTLSARLGIILAMASLHGWRFS